MARCQNCGNIISDQEQTCHICGAAVNSMGGNNYQTGYNQADNSQMYNSQASYNQPIYNQQYSDQQYPNYQNQQYNYQNQQNTYQGYNNANYGYGQVVCDPMDVQQNKAMGVLSYLGILVLIPLFGCKNSQFARFHASQGINLFLIEVVTSIITLITVTSLGVLSGVGALICILCRLVQLTAGVFSIIGIVNAVNGTTKELPLIGQLHIIQ